MSIKDKLSKINRRTFLQGTGVAVTMPFLDFMLDNKAYAQTGEIPARYLVMAGGISISRIKNGANNLYVPNKTGANYDLKRALRPIGDFNGLQDYISVVSNLNLPNKPWSNLSGVPPKGGFRGEFHRNALETQLTGTTVDEENYKYRGNKKILSEKIAAGPSSDRLLQNRLNYQNRFNHINLCVQPKVYAGKGNTLGERARTQFDMAGEYIAPQVSPRAFFQQMFGNFVDTDAQANEARLNAIQEKKSIIDLLDKRRIEQLNKLVSVESRQRIEAHFEHIREIEKQLDADQVVAQGICVKPQDPGSDPAIGPSYASEPKNEPKANFDTGVGYSNEEKRADVMTNLIAMAFACDISRVGTLRLTLDQSFMSAVPFTGVRSDYHSMSHQSDDGTDQQFADMHAWHTKQFARLCNRLRALPEAGGNILDNSAIIMVNEGGGGISTENGVDISPHSGQNMASLIGGKAGGLKGGVHIRTNQQHPTKVLISGMKAVGMTQNDLNDVSGVIGGLFS